MARLAWFTPLPPVRSGIAAYNAELLPLLAARHEIHVFTDPLEGSEMWHAAPGLGPGAPSQAASGTATSNPDPPGLDAGAERPVPAGPRVFSAHDFVWKHVKTPYDAVVYQLGNAACHDFMWPHLARYPGLVVLHDGQLHHERSRALLSRGRYDDYRAEFRYNHPEAPEHLPELVISTLAGSLYYLYPMIRWVVRTARLVAVHTDGLARRLSEAHPGVEVRTVRHGMLDPVTEATVQASRDVRPRHGIPAEALLFAAFGLVTPEKRISAALQGLARIAAERPHAHLLLAGGLTSYYDAAAEARALGIADRVHITGYVPDEDLAAHVLAADVCLCLRWPTSGETSGTWIRAIAAGKPTVVTDLTHNSHIPVLRIGAASEAAPRRSHGLPSPVAAAIDILREDEALPLAMSRLASDAGLRDALGHAGRDYWGSHHTMAGSVEDYARVIDRALERPIPRVRDLPAHLREDHTGLAKTILGEFGVSGGF